MKSDFNEAVVELVNQTETVDPDPAPTPFTFNTAPDKVGLPLESPAYVRKNCKHCLGRGFRTRLIGDGYMDTLDENGYAVRVPRKARQHFACICVHREYTRRRLALAAEKEVDSL
jgi:hypothetical protein